MKTQQISMRQMMSLLFIALLALGAEVVPGLRGAGAAAWLAPLLALLPVVLLLLLAFRHPAQEKRLDLGAGFLTAMGKRFGRVPALLFLLWGLFLLVVNSARCARRLTVAEGTPIFFSVVVLALAVWMAAKSLPAFARSCEIFYLAMSAGLVAVVVLAAFRLQPEFVLLLEQREVSAVPQVALNILGVASIGLYALFLAGDITVRPGDRARVLRWTIAFFLVLALLLALILGSFGAPLVEVMERPFIQLVAGLGLSGAFQRLESLISALWMLGDIALLGLLLFSVKRLTAEALGKAETLWPVVAAGVLAFVGGELLAGQEGLLRFSQQTLLPVGSLIAGVLLLLAFFWVKESRKTQNIGGKKSVENIVEKNPKKE